jgi:RsiW-degrading membrane proteinase PrsW (M82 family)
MEIAIWRGLTAVPCHFFDGIFMGYYLAEAKISDINKNYHSKKINIFLSILIPIIFHCIYDFCCLS